MYLVNVFFNFFLFLNTVHVICIVNYISFVKGNDRKHCLYFHKGHKILSSEVWCLFSLCVCVCVELCVHAREFLLLV